MIALFAAYTAAYISRCNLSPALDSIAKDFGISTAAVGLLPTCFAIPYAIGQVFAGLLADKLPASRLMGIGLFGSACINILFSFSPVFPMLLILWTLNGLLQSMIWTPVVRTLSTRFRREVRDQAVFFISLTIIFGYLIAWALAGFLTSLFSWRIGSLTCGLTTAVITVPAILSLRKGEQPAAEKQTDGSAWPAKPASIPHLLFHTNLLFLLVCCFGCGYVRDGITNWTAKLLMDTQGIDLSSAVGILLILP
ncbi:MAG: MFS transporter, partial [Erysipelotrichaceae bacterium]|nr:MFS transporter [Erysipelotrichaceae bacterium]